MASDYLKILGTNLRRQRKKRELTQEDVADQAGLTPSYYGRIERGQINVTLLTLSGIARALNIDIPSLLGDEFGAADVKRLHQEVNERVRKLDPKRLQLVRELLYNFPSPKNPRS